MAGSPEGQLEDYTVGRRPPRRGRGWAGLAALLGLGACLTHPVEDGAWRLVQARSAETIDSCGLLAADGSLGEGPLRENGVDVRFDCQVPGLASRLPMVGRAKQPQRGQPDELILEGSLGGESLSIAGAACSVAFGQVELTGAVEDARRFSGTLVGRYELSPSADPRCPAVCNFSVGCLATWQGR